MNKSFKAKMDKRSMLLKKAAIPLIKYLNENYHPHVTAIVTPTGVEVLSGECSVQDVFDYVRD